MSREQKTRPKASQKSKQRVGAATQVDEATQTTADATTNGTNTMTTNASDETVGAQTEQVAIEQSRTSSKQVVWPGLQPSWESWPTSKPGPRSTPPIPGTLPINAFRPEQCKEIGYNQQLGEPAIQSPLRSLPEERTSGPTSFDQPVAQSAPGRGKQRL
jgi:hypothetical protein